MSVPRVAVIGGGFSGAAFAVHLARTATRLQIDLIEPRAVPGAGIAYGDAAPEHRINVPSDRMQVFAEDPLHFTRWLQRSGAFEADPPALTELGHHYSRRSDFGAYMADLLRETAAGNPSGSTIRHVRAEVRDIAQGPAGWLLTLNGGRVMRHSAAVVCASHAAPEFRWPLRARIDDTAGLVHNPWDTAAVAAIAPSADVVVAGSGLTMADIVVSLQRRGHRGRITAISRHALLPRVHADFDDHFGFLQDAAAPASARALLRLTRLRVAEAVRRGLDWRAALDALRRELPAVWAALPAAERRRTARTLRPWWDVHRFRMAPQVAAQLAEARSDGRLQVLAGRIESVRRAAARWQVEWRPRGGDALRTPCDVFINCTGPNGDLARSSQPLFRSLFERGLARADPLRLGLDVDAQGCLIDASGTATALLRAAGPLARAEVAEVTGVPEASAHTRRVAEDLSAALLRIQGMAGRA